MRGLFGGGAYLIFGLTSAGLIRGRGLFNFWSYLCGAYSGGGAYLIFGLTSAGLI